MIDKIIFSLTLILLISIHQTCTFLNKRHLNINKKQIQHNIQNIRINNIRKKKCVFNILIRVTLNLVLFL